jgi:murein DD-endopeptidase MepM/ murein hydrolase activator NlpD
MSEDGRLFLLVRDGENAHRRIALTARARRIVVGGGLILCATLLVLGTFVALNTPDAVRTQQLERRNALLTEELEALRARVGALQDELEVLAEHDAELRILAGLDAIDEEVRQVGVGGPGTPELEAHPLYEVDRETGRATFAAAYDLSALERRARLLSESLHEAADSLQAHRDLLESTPSILPTIGYLSSGFSASRLHPIHHRPLPHEGIDISAPRGTPILAAAKGRVTFAGRRAGYGLLVEIDHGYGYSTLYGHASQVMVRVGQDVQRGDVIAQVGNTGLATSPHLHYEVRVGGRPVNPMNYVISGAVP